jgi:hypothetical protein
MQQAGRPTLQSISIQEILMKTLFKAMTKLIIFGALAASPLYAQFPDGLTFKTSFPFYVGNRYMPAGSYVVTEGDLVNSQWLLVQDADYTRAAWVGYIPTDSLTPANKSQVTFNKYGDVAFLASLSVSGDNYGTKILEGKREKQTALAEHKQGSIHSVLLEAIRARN